MSEPKLTSLFRIQTLLLLSEENAKSGYDLAKELKSLSGKKPSSGKMYPFLHELRDSGYIEEREGNEPDGRNRTEYILTNKGLELKEELTNRMANLLDIRLEQRLDTCHHCGVKLLDSKVEGKDKSQSPVVFCCHHCKDAYLSQ
ncbi:MAG: PadR family transcriptional regulator [Candidatus Heimdallarchaeota archaeon]|nr:PadR family transcriptional regulator [Candidatus Heimdallarchaeota archaeon]